MKFIMLILIYQGAKGPGLLMGLCFFLVPSSNIFLLKRSDALYKDIIRKVC